MIALFWWEEGFAKMAIILASLSQDETKQKVNVFIC